MATTYDISDKIRETVTFKNASSAVADPTAVKCHVKVPSGGVTTHTYAPSTGLIVKSGTGVFYLDITTTGHGEYGVRWDGTGTVVASVEGYFSVRPRRVTT